MVGIGDLENESIREDYADRVVVLYDGEEKVFMCYEKLIKAWQPLPEPYKGEEAAGE